MLSNNHEKIASYSKNAARRLDEINATQDSDKQPAPWKEIYKRFCESRRQYPDILSAMESSEAPASDAPTDHPVETLAFDAKAGLDIITQKEPEPTESKDYMGDASIFQTESIWVFQEPKSEVFDKADEPIPASEFEFLRLPNERPPAPIPPSEFDFLKPTTTKSIEPTKYPLPDMVIPDTTPRTPSRKRYFPTPASEQPCDASIALFEWESVLPPSPHEKRQTRVDLSMDFLLD
uniref:Uncharacterized protein n=1 Tax=Paramoeba aestuarina TaxID=180227 RepID=A0A7S4PJN5_9EUKA